MVSHCTASLKLTPWHEGTFASAVIYSPPPATPPPLSSPPHLLTPNPLPSSLPLTGRLKNDIHYFIVKQQSFFSCSPGTGEDKEKRKAGGRKWGTNGPNHSPARFFFFLFFFFFRQGNWRSSLCDPAGPCWKWLRVPPQKRRRSPALWGNTAACARCRLLGQSRKGRSEGKGRKGKESGLSAGSPGEDFNQLDNYRQPRSRLNSLKVLLGWWQQS